MSEAKINNVREIIFLQEERLTATYKNFLILVIFNCLGLLMFLYGFINLNLIPVLLSGVICSFPIFIFIIKAGGIKTFYRELISDLPEQYEAENNSNNNNKKFAMLFFTVLIGTILALFIGWFLSLALFIFILKKYIGLYLKMCKNHLL